MPLSLHHYADDDVNVHKSPSADTVDDLGVDKWLASWERRERIIINDQLTALSCCHPGPDV